MVKKKIYATKKCTFGVTSITSSKIFQIEKTRRIWTDLVEIYQMRWGQKRVFPIKFCHFDSFFYSDTLISVTVWMVKSRKINVFLKKTSDLNRSRQDLFKSEVFFKNIFIFRLLTIQTVTEIKVSQ